MSAKPADNMLCVMRAKIGRTADGFPILGELWVTTQQPTAKMLREMERYAGMCAGWFEEDEAAERATPSEVAS